LEKVSREENEALQTGREPHEKIEAYPNRLISHNQQTDLTWAAAQTSSCEELRGIWEEFNSSFLMPSPSSSIE
jgi:hypothetical protein